MQVDHEHIRKEHWLPDGEPVLQTDSRGKTVRRDIEVAQSDRGGVEFRVAQHLTRNVMNYLHELDILDSQHVYDGQTYEVWQAIFTAPLGYGRNALYTELRAHLGDMGFKDSEFPKLIRMLSLRQKKLVEHAIYTVATDHHRWLAMRRQHLYREAFDRLTESLKTLYAQKPVDSFHG